MEDVAALGEATVETTYLDPHTHEILLWLRLLDGRVASLPPIRFRDIEWHEDEGWSEDRAAADLLTLTPRSVAT